MTHLIYKYSKLLSVGIEQLYYSNRIGRSSSPVPVPDFLIIPAAETIDLMKRRDYLMRTDPLSGGFGIYAQVLGTNGAGDELLRFRNSIEDKLVFFLLTNNAGLLTYNDLPTNLSSDQIYYFNNDIDDVVATRDSLHLSKDASGVKQADSIKKSTSQYHYHHNSPVLAGTAKVKHLLSGRLIEAGSLVNEGGEAELFFDLKDLPLGSCQLLINGLLTQQFYHIGMGSYSSIFGVLELSLDSLLKANYRVVEPDFSLTPQRPFYKLLFTNRPTKWRYRIQLDDNSPLNLEINALAEPARTAFINDINITTNGGISFIQQSFVDRQFVFVSSGIVPLQEKYLTPAGKVLQVSLKKNISTVAKPVKDYLPYPSVRLLDNSQLPTIYSDIFLTI